MQRFFLSILATALLAGCASAPSLTSVPLPPDVAISTPDNTLPAERRAFSGKWAGKWRGLAGGQQQETVLIVENLTADGATVVYAQGDHSRFPAFFRRTQARFVGTKLNFSFEQRTPVSFSYELQPDGTLKAESLSRGFTAVSTLNRVNS
ncbi:MULTISPECIES: hypothetical protein [unclassified Variovorax]|uniref:hypothetical protein n=1 Tax=unclassified Variovorax TaxID=663243 RepID=UPI0032E5DF60